MEKKIRKLIGLSQETYDKLEAFRDKRETFSEAVERLLAAGAEFNRLADILEGAAKFRESQAEKLDEQRRGN